ncbi:MAG: ABC transporter permease [Paracoccus sp. (in: a-proteobacteria)]|uniref:ABC transporter permease n=1 Tax=Paracoccus sp. TaxID=267 RepID=UPI0039E5F361
MRKSRRNSVQLNVLQQYAAAWIFPLCVVAVWQYVGANRMLADGLFPSFTTSIAAFWDFLTGSIGTSPYSGQWLKHLGASFQRIMIGYLIGAAVGVVLGLMVGFYPLVRHSLHPTINAIRPVSITAWIPLALIVLGIGDKPAYFLTALATFFPVYINSMMGASYADGGLVRAAEMLGASRKRILFSVTLPAALPSIAAGLRVALALAWTTVVVAEMLGARSGIGYVLIDSYSQFRLDYVIACMFTLGILGTVSDRVLGWLLGRRLRWVAVGAKA